MENKDLSVSVEILPPSWMKVGDNIEFQGDSEDATQSIEIIGVCNARVLARGYGLNLTRDIPVYQLKRNPHNARGSYSFENDFILFYPNTNEKVRKHEIVHAIEMSQVVSSELEDFFRRVIDLFPEGIEFNGAGIFNFKKNVHELVADGYTEQSVIQAFKEKDIYTEFLSTTKYLHVLA